MKNIVFLPGLGADKRLFEFIRTESSQNHYVHWVKPDAGESLQDYVKKIKEQVASVESPVLVGVSLGGIVAMELREMIPVSKTILISSIKCSEEKPTYFEWVKMIHLNEFIPPSLLKKGAPWIKPFLDSSNKEEAFRLFQEMAFDADEDFINWGIRKVLDWEKADYDKTNIVHIHGTSDMVFPIRHLKHCDYPIAGGSHDIIMARADDVNTILAKEIASAS